MFRALRFHAEELGGIPEYDFLGVWPLDQSQCVSIRGARLSYPNSRAVQSIQASLPFILSFSLNLLLEAVGSLTLIYKPPFSSRLHRTGVTCDFTGHGAGGSLQGRPAPCTASVSPLSQAPSISLIKAEFPSGPFQTCDFEWKVQCLEEQRDVVTDGWILVAFLP